MRLILYLILAKLVLYSATVLWSERTEARHSDPGQAPVIARGG